MKGKNHGQVTEALLIAHIVLSIWLIVLETGILVAHGGAGMT